MNIMLVGVHGASVSTCIGRRILVETPELGVSTHKCIELFFPEYFRHLLFQRRPAQILGDNHSVWIKKD